MILFLVPLFVLMACNKNESDGNPIDENLSLSGQIDRLIENNEYERGLSILEEEDAEDPEIRLLLEKTHLNYGLYSMNTFDPEEMRTHMNLALVQFAEVIKLNPDNSVAREQIHQIMGVYATMPDRSPDEETLEKLRETGFDY